MSWQEVWEKKGCIEDEKNFELNDLIKYNGYDTGAGAMNEPLWMAYISRIQALLNVTPVTNICEVGCGSGACLYPLYQQGISVTGIDYSETLLAIAQLVMPENDFYIGEACQLPCNNQFDVVLSSSVFHYFPNFDYAEQAISEMKRITQVQGQIAILDVPDLEKYEAANNFRRGQLSVTEYKSLYADYQHLYYEKEWFFSIAEKLDLDAQVFDQDLTGYGNAPYRFNVILTK